MLQEISLGFAGGRLNSSQDKQRVRNVTSANKCAGNAPSIFDNSAATGKGYGAASFGKKRVFSGHFNKKYGNNFKNLHSLNNLGGPKTISSVNNYRGFSQTQNNFAGSDNFGGASTHFTNAQNEVISNDQMSQKIYLQNQSQNANKRLKSAATQINVGRNHVRQILRSGGNQSVQQVLQTMEIMPSVNLRQEFLISGTVNMAQIAKKPPRPVKQLRCGIQAIDVYYENLNFASEVEQLRFSTEFRRLMTLIQQHWAAYKFPQCEMIHVKQTIQKMIDSTRVFKNAESILEQVQHYLKFLKHFTKVEDKIKNLFELRQSKMVQLEKLTESYYDLKKFESQGPHIMLQIRDITLRLVYALQQFKNLKNRNYTEAQINRDKQGVLANSPFYFEMVKGHGNILDLIRNGQYTVMSQQKAGRKRLQVHQMSTFLLKKMSIFLKDDKVLFIPKESDQIDIDINLALKKDRNMRFNVQETGIFEKMVSLLKPINQEHEQILLENLAFIMDNSQETQTLRTGGVRGSHGSLFSQSLYLRDSKGRSLQNKTHRDLLVPTRRKSQDNNLDLATSGQIYFDADRDGLSMNISNQNQRISKIAKQIPLTSFEWKQPMDVLREQQQQQAHQEAVQQLMYQNEDLQADQEQQEVNEEEGEGIQQEVYPAQENDQIEIVQQQ